MEIIGFEKNSFVDFPGKIACVLFTPGCNMNCWYCHNKQIIKETKGVYLEENIFKFLSERKNFLDGVVISGGEPTLQKDLKEFITKIKNMGFLVKLDTNGTNPKVVEDLVNENLLDYIAMDIKTGFEKYKSIIGVTANIENIKSSIEFIKNCGVNHEFRTTFAEGMTVGDIAEIAKTIGDARAYFIQKYNPENPDEEVSVNKKLIYSNALRAAQEFTKNAKLRGY